MMDNVDWGFLLTVIGATVVKILSSPYHSLLRAGLTIFAALFSAYVFTDPVMDFFVISEGYEYAIAALLALTGEGLMRMIMSLANDPVKLIEIWNLWRKG